MKGRQNQIEIGSIQGCQMVYFQRYIFKGLAIEDVSVFLWPFCRFYGHLVYFMAIWYIFPLLVCYIKKNLATLDQLP
jgi:hypothetical protein